MLSKTIGLLIAVLALPLAQSEILCYVCDDCPRTTFDHFHYLEICNLPPIKMTTTTTTTTTAASNENIQQTSTINRYDVTASNDMTSIYDTSTDSLADATSRLACYKIHVQVNKGIEVNRGCVRTQGNRNDLCKSVHNNSYVTQCHFCYSDLCNRAIKSRIAYWLSTIAGILLSVFRNKFW